MQVNSFTPTTFVPGDGTRFGGGGPGGEPPRRSRRWAVIVVVMLATHMLLMVTAMVIALRTRPEIIPNAYERALKWDEERAAPAGATTSTSTTAAPATPVNP